MEIGRLKQGLAMPVYEPDREKVIFENIAQLNQGPLSQIQLRQVYERLIDVMRQLQKDEMVPAAERTHDGTELEPQD
jgi:chorismate mutase